MNSVVVSVCVCVCVCARACVRACVCVRAPIFMNRLCGMSDVCSYISYIIETLNLNANTYVQLQ
jgi:hypothetical protein